MAAANALFDLTVTRGYFFEAPPAQRPLQLPISFLPDSIEENVNRHGIAVRDDRQSGTDLDFGILLQPAAKVVVQQVRQPNWVRRLRFAVDADPASCRLVAVDQDLWVAQCHCILPDLLPLLDEFTLVAGQGGHRIRPAAEVLFPAIDRLGPLPARMCVQREALVGLCWPSLAGSKVS